jgi:hypothetical protein
LIDYFLNFVEEIVTEDVRDVTLCVEVCGIEWTGSLGWWTNFLVEGQIPVRQVVVDGVSGAD